MPPQVTDETRKFWADWVRREIGGPDMVQEAAVFSALSELQQGHDAQAAADGARRTAESLGVVVKPSIRPPAMPGGTAIPAPGAPVAAPTAPRVACKLCGSTPAARVTLHEHNGRIIWMTHKTNKGPFCRDCGIALLRHHTNSTLYQGWFGIFSFFMTPITLLLNLNAWRTLKGLAAPQRDPSVQSRIPAPLNPGKPLVNRPGPYVGLIVVAAAAALLGLKGADTGGCLDNSVEMGNRVTTMHNTYVEHFNADTTAIDACATLACEQAPKLDLAAALTTYNKGLATVCWPSKAKDDAARLQQVNTETIAAFTAWAGATSLAEDKQLAQAAAEKVRDRRAADDIVSADLGVQVGANPASS